MCIALIAPLSLTSPEDSRRTRATHNREGFFAGTVAIETCNTSSLVCLREYADLRCRLTLLRFCKTVLFRPAGSTVLYQFTTHVSRNFVHIPLFFWTSPLSHPAHFALLDTSSQENSKLFLYCPPFRPDFLLYGVPVWLWALRPDYHPKKAIYSGLPVRGPGRETASWMC